MVSPEFDSAPVADYFEAYWSLGETEMALLYADHVHQNTKGYAFMASTVKAATNEHYLSVPEPRGLALSIATPVTVAVVFVLRGQRAGDGHG